MKKLFSEITVIVLMTVAMAWLLLSGCKKEELAVLPADAGTITQTIQDNGYVLLSVDKIAGADTYNWYKDGENVQSTDSRTYLAIESGLYKVAGVNANGEGKSSPECEVEISGSDLELPADAGEISQEEQEDGLVLLSVEEIERAETYRWYKDDVEVQNTEERTYLVRESGVYKVAGVNEVGEGKTSLPVTLEIGDVFNILTDEIVEDEELRNWIKEVLAGGSETYTNVQAAAYTGTIMVPDKTASLKGLEYFTSMSGLSMTECKFLPSPLDLSSYKSLQVIEAIGLSVSEVIVKDLEQLKSLSLSKSQYISTLDLSSQKVLETLVLSGTAINTVDFSPVTSTLKTLRWSSAVNPSAIDLKIFEVIDTVDISQASFGTLDLSGMATLRALTCSNCSLTDINLSGCTSLEYLVATFNSLTSIDVSDCVSLKYLYLMYNDKAFSSIDLNLCRSTLIELNLGSLGFTSFDASGMSSLEYLSLSENPMDGAELDLNDCVSLKEFRAEDCHLSALKIENCSNLVQFWCYGNELTSLKFAPSMPNLKMAYIGQIEELTGRIDFGDCPNLENIQLYYCTDLEEIDITGCPALTQAYLYGVGVERLDISNNTQLGIENAFLAVDGAPNLKQIKVWSDFDMNNLPTWAKYLPDGIDLVYEFD